ncbi:phosphatase PAP2 family protein [Streptomyces sp. SP18CS02]|uniref:phosphatase PAP2 family protein n=1 Tax=Streptomyces sp. SP18CS02 TaxID=3002531 RepID=UPI002E789E3A|nr:phosphatase PAP2 family protein [Streptomyces sp. SP18CS02]MEE1751045.1 phosphatase PAP2 family protein [Streptomyces sp. SP18CS02]
MAAGIRPEGPETTDTRRPPLVRELLLVTALFVMYKLGRRFANGHEARAFDNADRVWDLERAVRLPGEGLVQDLLMHNGSAVHLANLYYAGVHFPATVAFLAWLYWRRPAHYLWSRRVLALLTASALALHLLVPLAPPRMLAAAGLVDTAQVYGPSVYGATPETDTMANQFAAMPSLHFGWALMVAVGLIAATRSRWRTLWLLHPLITLLVVVGTANHYWLDALVATALLGAALAVVRAPVAPADELPAGHRAAGPSVLLAGPPRIGALPHEAPLPTALPRGAARRAHAPRTGPSRAGTPRDDTPGAGSLRAGSPHPEAPRAGSLRLEASR